MKGLQIAVLLALLVLCMSYVEALRCNYVFTVGGRGYNTIQTCQDDDDVCVSVRGQIPPIFGASPVLYRRCMKSSMADSLKDIKWLGVDTCSTDLCN